MHSDASSCSAYCINHFDRKSTPSWSRRVSKTPPPPSPPNLRGSMQSPESPRESHSFQQDRRLKLTHHAPVSVLVIQQVARAEQLLTVAHMFKSPHKATPGRCKLKLLNLPKANPRAPAGLTLMEYWHHPFCPSPCCNKWSETK